MEKYKEQINDRQAEESKRDNVLRPKLKKTLDERDLTKTQKEEQQKAAEEKSAEVVAQQKKLDDLKKEIAAKEDQVREQKASIDALADQLKELGDVKELASKMRRMSDELVQLQSDIDQTTTKLNNLIAEKNRTAAVITAYEEENAWRNANLSNPKLSTRISAIYDTYGFVTLPVGNNAGVVGGSSLDVVRDGEVVAKLLVKTVEASTAAAEIIPDSLRPDTVLMVGDQIRASAGKKPVTAPAPVPAAPVEAAPDAAAPAEPAAPAAEAEKPAAEPAEADPFQ
jgi:myosin heavy subunit